MTRATTRRNEAAGGRRAGFSLLELLVVIGIIAILALLLLPATGTIMEICRATVCRGNLRQLGVAAFAYHTDNELMGVAL